MKIRNKTLSILGITFVFLFVILMVSIGQIMINSFNELEKDDIEINIGRATAAIDTEILRLDTIAEDWGAWNDTYFFVTGENERFPDENLDPETIVNLGIDIMLFYDDSRQPYYSAAIDTESHESVEVPAALIEYIETEDAMFEYEQPVSHHEGIINSPEGALLAASHTITMNSREGPVAGTLIVARYLDRGLVEEFEVQTLLSLDTRKIEENTIIPEEGYKITYRNATSLTGTTVLEDINKEPALLLDMKMSRDVYMQGQAALRYVFIAILLIGISYGLVLSISLEKSVIKRLFTLNEKLSTITDNGTLSSRIDMDGSDELYELAENINYMLEALELEEEVLETMDVLESSLNSINTGIMVIHNNGNVIMNSNFTNMWNLNQFTVDQNDVDENLRYIASQLDGEENIESRIQIMETETGDEKVSLKLKNGSFYDWYRGPLLQKGNRIGTVYCTTDITDSVRLQEIEQENRQRLEKVLSKIICGVMIIDIQKHQIVDVNSIAEEIIGLPKDEIVGRDYFEFLCPPEEGECPATDMGMVIDRSERIVINKRRERVPVLKSAVPITLSGKEYLVESFVDMTQVKEVEKNLINAKLAAESANRAKSDFLATMSHELRTPLSLIIGFSELLAEGEEGKLTETQTKYLNNIFASGEHLLTLINNVLDLSEIEADRLDLNPEAFKISEVFNDVNHLALPLAEKKRIMMEFSIDEEISFIQADKTRFKQILFNLVSNSVKFTPQDGEIKIHATKIGNRAKFTVEDNGIGISEEDKKKLFQPFRQLDSSTSRHYGGMGLGLYLAKKFVEMHHGNIWFESKVGEGTTFTFEMPINSSINENGKDQNTEPNNQIKRIWPKEAFV